MIRLLVLGDRALEWGDRVRRESRGRFEVEGVRRPAAGIRKLESWSPDAVAVAEPSASRQAPMVDAVRARPLGSLVPVILLGDAAPPPDLDVDDALGSGASVDRLHQRIQRLLGDEEDAAQGASAAEIEPDAGRGGLAGQSSSARQRQGAADRDYVIEPLQETEAAGAAGSQARRLVKPADIERKLTEIRHRDYFSALEVARSAEAEAVREEYRRLKQQFQPDRLDPAVAREYEQALDEIHEALDDAVAVLADDELRKAYLDRTTRK